MSTPERLRELSAGVIAEMYRDPFWQERFGGRGRGHAGRDGDFHVQYLVEALAANDAGVFVKYATWLREVLVTRGMCSRHLSDNFRLLADAIAREPWPDSARAAEIVRAGAASLAHADGEAATIERARPELVEQLVAETGAGRDDVDHLLSYFADAVALNRPELFDQHVSFMTDFHARRGRPAHELSTMVSALRRAVAARGAKGRP